MDYRWEALNEWHLLPLKGGILTFLNGNTHTFDHLMKGSTWTLKPILASKKTSHGGTRIVGYKSEITLITSQTNFKVMRPILEDINKSSLTQIYCLFQESDFLTFLIQSNQTYVSDFSIEFEINYSQESMGPELAIKVSILMTKDIIDEANFNVIFNQSWG